MRRLSAVFLVLSVLAGCGSSGGGNNNPPPSGPTTYYVRAAGSDENDGLTPETAFRHISHAASNFVSPGDVVVVGPGTYRAQPPPLGPSGTAVDITGIEGTAGAPVIFLADPTGALTDDSPGEVIVDANDRPTAFRLSRSTFITLDGFTVIGAKGGNDAVGILARIKSADVTIRNCTIRGNVNGIRIQDSDDAVLFNNLVADNQTVGVRIANGARRARIVNNTIVDSGTRGLSIGGSANADGSGSTGAQVRNNIIQDNSNVNIVVEDGPPSSLVGYVGNFNLVFTPDIQDQTKTYRPASIRGSNDVNFDARFVSPSRADYHLDQAASPALNAGTGAADPGLISELFSRSTAPDGAPDEPPIDLGYHYPAAVETPAP